jgi:hypothetical protein
MADKSFIGKGIVYLNGRDVGNCTALTLGVTEEKIELKNYRTAAGGNYNSLTRIDSVEVSMTISDFSVENLALGMFGTTSAVTAAEVANEAIAAPASLAGDPLIKTANVIDTAETVTVTSSPAGTTFTAGTDYTVTPAGIRLVSATTTITASQNLLITYDKKPVDVLQALTTSAGEYELVFDGLNEAQSGVPYVVTVHRFKAGPAAEIALIGDEFGELQITGEALADTSITTAGLSQYAEIKAA